MSDVRTPDVVDPDVDLRDAPQRRETRPRQWDLVAAVAAGGVIGAEARYGLSVAIPHGTAAFPWSTLVTNLTGCLCIGALMVLLLELTSPHRLARPFLGVGVLGGYTTFSTFAVDTERLVIEHQPLMALIYAGVTASGCILCVWLSSVGMLTVGQMVIDRRVRRRSRMESRT